jgi:transcriptional regulator with XRE-family HTH domain
MFFLHLCVADAEQTKPKKKESDMTLVEQLGKTITLWRGRRSVRSLSAAGGMAHHSFWRAEKGEAVDGPSLRQVEAIARTLEVEPWELIAGKRKDQMLRVLLKERGAAATETDVDRIVSLAAALHEEPEALAALERMATQRPEAFRLLIRLWENPAVGQVTLEAVMDVAERVPAA